MSKLIVFISGSPVGESFVPYALKNPSTPPCLHVMTPYLLPADNFRLSTDDYRLDRALGSFSEGYFSPSVNHISTLLHHIPF